MNEPKCVWSKKLADVAVQTVLTLGTDLIIKRIPGQTYVYMHGDGEGKNRKPLGPEVSRKRIISVFNWIIAQTKGFRVPLLVNFSHGDAPTVGLGILACDPMLSNELYALEKAGLHMPRINFGWHNGPLSPLMMVSNLERTQGIMGYPLDGVTTINIHGVIQKPERIMFLEDIPL